MIRLGAVEFEDEDTNKPRVNFYKNVLNLFSYKYKVDKY
ncbi:hypothetical protein PCIT_b0552 [Pseudoalteromonas citrea]|uniref:Uncharacterized protein n=1 Tax=Pseudoalteromonas citrea TaxID=43655 RepID=A0AAD4AES8_9GAMM|nr:hypothetical protein PCIT_b0552 [Pseudoalteromonas citrea]